MTVPHDEGRAIIARGRIRVDARRALAKLREHLLVDLHLYTVEIARAAVAAGATFLDIRHDADDVVLTFDGEPIPTHELPRLLDHVLGDNAASARALRGVALGVNAALGLRPSFVDIYIRRKEGSDKPRASRVRFLPSVLQAEDADLPPVEDVPVPEAMPERGTRVHVRRRMSLDVLKRAAARDVPREIALLVEALGEAPLELRRDGAPYPRPPRAEALLRVPFRERDVRRGMVEILAAPSAAPAVDYLELGVLLLRRPFLADPLFPTTAHAQVELPVRVVVDADELPTNASRSALREDAVLPQRAEQAARAALVDALRTLVALVTGEGEPIAGVEVLQRDATRLEDALGAFTCIVAGARLRGAEIADHARALLDLPLLRDATNRPLRPAALLAGKAEKIHVWNGKEPLDAELGPWMDEVVWLQDRVVERILGDFTLADAAPLIAAAQAGLERRRRLHARPPIAPTVPPSPEHVVRETFQVQEGPFRGLRGELALGAEGLGTGERPSSIRIFVEGRHLDTVEVDRQTLPLALDAAIAWDGRLVPRFTYEGIRLDESLNLAIFQLTRLALLALGSYIERLAEEKRTAERERAASLVRAAVGAYVVAADQLDIDTPPPEPPLSAYTPVWTRGFWRTTEQARVPVSLAELKVYADRTGAICYAPPGTSGAAPDRRPVVAVDDLERSWLEGVFPGVTFVPYARALLAPGAEAPSRAAMMEELLATRRGHAPFGETLPVMPFDIRGGRGLIAPGKVDEILWLHAGILLSAAPTGHHIEPATLVIEYDGVVPNPAWNGVHWTRDAGFLASVRNELLQRILAALEGDREARRSLRDFSTAPGSVLRSYLLAAAARYRKKDLAERIEALAIFQSLGEDGAPRLASLAEIRRHHPPPGPIPVLRAAPGFATLDWRPVIVADDDEFAALSRWSESRAARVDDQLEKRQSRARIEQDKRAFLEKPALDPRVPSHLADPESPVAFSFEEPAAEEPEAESEITVAAALPRRGIDLARAEVEFLYKGRLVCTRQLPEMPLPVLARVELRRLAWIDNFRDIKAEGLARAARSVWIASCALAAELVKRAAGRAGAERFFEDRRSLALVEAVLRTPGPEENKIDILQLDFALRAKSLLWLTVQGDAVPYNELTPGGSKLHAGRVCYPEWRRQGRSQSALDKPIVYLPTTPEGNLIRAILVHMGHEIVDVSEALEEMQQERMSGGGRKAPTLGGAPEHPALRASLEALGAAGLAGELEIIAGPATEVHLEDLRGKPHPVTVESNFALRARVRVDTLDISAEEKRKAVAQIAKTATKHLESLADRVDELPPFVRRDLRRVLCAVSRKAKNLAERRTKWRVIPDIYGGFHSIEEIGGAGSAWPYTRREPPYPSARREPPPLRLTPEEAEALASRVSLADKSSSIQLALEGEQRRNAPALARIGLDLQQRMQCLAVVPFRGDGVDGEIGILAPEHIKSRSIAVHVSRRPLCVLPFDAGWPVIAAVNDDTLEPNAAFDGLKGGQRTQERLRERVEAQARDAMREWFAPPAGILAEKSIHTHLPAAQVFVTGMIWLPASWRAAGLLEVRAPSSRVVGYERLTVQGLRHLDGTLPVAGRLLIASMDGSRLPENAQAALAGVVLQEAAAMVEAAAEQHGDNRVLQCYRWNLRLIGAPAGELVAPAADGQRIGAGDIVAELEARGALWTTRREGTDLGAFPKDAPSFILLDDGGPLMDVLRLRTKALRELGGIPTTPAAPTVSVEKVERDASPEWYSPRPRPPAPAKPLAEDPALFHAPDVPESVARPEPPPEPAASWFSGLVRRVALLFDPAEPPPDPATQELGQTLLASIQKLGLAPNPVVSGIRYVRKGRPFRYDDVTGELVVNRAHPAVQKLADRAPKDARARVLLVAAAVREINRALEIVTDATERRVLLTLLRGEEE